MFVVRLVYSLQTIEFMFLLKSPEILLRSTFFHFKEVKTTGEAASKRAHNNNYHTTTADLIEGEPT